MRHSTSVRIQPRPRHDTGAGHEPPSAPGTLTATPISGTEIDLSWGRSDRQRRHRGLSSRSVPGRGLHQLQQVWDSGHRHELRRHVSQPEYERQLHGRGPGSGRQSGTLVRWLRGNFRPLTSPTEALQGTFIGSERGQPRRQAIRKCALSPMLSKVLPTSKKGLRTRRSPCSTSQTERQRLLRADRFVLGLPPSPQNVMQRLHMQMTRSEHLREQRRIA